VRPLSRFGWGFLAASLLAACDLLLEVDSPTLVPPSDLDNPANAQLLVRNAIADFECAFAGYVTATAVLTDELYSSTSFQGNGWDRRLIRAAPSNLASTEFASGDCAKYTTAGYGYGVYTPLSTARFQATDAVRRITSFPDSLVPGGDTAKARLLATAAAYAGYSYTLFGEGFCTAAFDGGPALSGPEVLQLAEQRFTASINIVQADSSVLNMARVGRARVRLDLAGKADSAGDPALAAQKRAEAAADASLVPATFVRFASRTASSPIVVASWKEAQLIVAEAEGGQSAVQRINVLRSRFPGLPLFASSDSLEILKQVARERRAELYLEGHRLNDRLRLRTWLGIPPTVLCPACFTNLAEDSATLGLAWETGRNHKNPPQTYQTTTCLPLPTLETDNNDSIPP
jgi:hypothetical protein